MIYELVQKFPFDGASQSVYTDVRFVFAEGLAMGPEAEARAVADAQAQIAGLLNATETV